MPIKDIQKRKESQARYRKSEHGHAVRKRLSVNSNSLAAVDAWCKTANRKTRETATMHFLPWSCIDDCEAFRDDLTVRQIAIRLGRTMKAVAARRAKLRKEDGPDMLLASGDSNPEIITALLSVEIPTGAGSDDVLPEEIQYMPPGSHTITATQGGKKVTKTVRVTEAGAKALQAFYEKAKKNADAGTGDLPYFDFNHDDKEASAHPVEFRWGGDDPKTGGIRAKLEWTKPGSEAVLGKTYRRFSPAFTQAANGEVNGSDINMGGLVNRAAFTLIQPIRSKAGADDQQPENNTDTPMKTLLAILAKAGLISSPDLDEASAVSQFQTNHAAIVAKQADLSTQVTALTTKNGELDGLLKAAQAENEKVTKAQAVSAIDAAVVSGRIAPKDDALKAKWVDAFARDPEGTQAMLDSLPQNPALRTIVKAKDASAAAGANGEHPFLVKAKAYATEHKVSDGDAIMTVAKADPKLYDEYRDSLVVYGKH